MSGIKGCTWLRVLGFRFAGGKCNLVIWIGERNVVSIDGQGTEDRAVL